MKEHPILFNGDMVRAILDGRKTQTRRIIKPQPTRPEDFFTGFPGPYFKWKNDLYPCESFVEFSPWFVDRLWVREAWQGPLTEYENWDRNNYDQYKKTQFCKYRADGGPTPEWVDDDDELRYGWSPSIHMPRWASRITLEITNVRVERVQDISEDDAKAEGIPRGVYGYRVADDPFTEVKSAKLAFASLWESTYPGSWERNDWVWVVEFRRVKP